MGLNELVFGSLTVLGIVVFLFVVRFRANRSQRERADRLRWNAVDKEQSSEKKSWISMGVVGGTNCDRPVPWGRIRPGHRATWP
jgi:hypothetical protein